MGTQLLKKNDSCSAWGTGAGVDGAVDLWDSLAWPSLSSKHETYALSRVAPCVVTTTSQKYRDLSNSNCKVGFLLLQGLFLANTP